MTGVLLAFLSGIFTGGADFLGGVAGRRASVPAVSALAFAVSAVGAVLISPLIGGSLTAEVWFWGLLAGVGISIGSVALFTGIGFGRVAIVAPLSAVISAAMPVAFEIAIGGRPGFLVWMGIVFAIGAVVLVTRENEQVERSLRLSLVTGVVAGISVGVVYVVISRVAHEGTWVLVPAGIVTSILLWLWLLAHREALLPPRAVRPLTLAVGLMSLLGVGLFVLAADRTLLSVASVLTSMYPATTMLLAAVIWRQRPTSLQWLGLVTALFAVALLTVGTGT